MSDHREMPIEFRLLIDFLSWAEHSTRKLRGSSAQIPIGLRPEYCEFCSGRPYHPNTVKRKTIDHNDLSPKPTFYLDDPLYSEILLTYGHYTVNNN